MDIEQGILNAVREGLSEAIKAKLQAYNSPVDKLIAAAVGQHESLMRTLINEAFSESLGDTTFRDDIKRAVRHSLAKSLVQKFGGEIEKQVNTLKSDPSTRARITLAIEEIVASK
jgi:O-succinylbenzoate synthase